MPIVLITNDDNIKYFDQDDILLPNKGGVTCLECLDRNTIDKIESIVCANRSLDDIRNEIKVAIFHYIETLGSEDSSVTKTDVFAASFFGAVIGTALSIYIGQGVKSDWSAVKFMQNSFSWKK